MTDKYDIQYEAGHLGDNQSIRDEFETALRATEAVVHQDQEKYVVSAKVEEHGRISGTASKLGLRIGLPAH